MTQPIQALLQRAKQHHQRKALVEAEQLYRQILALEPEQHETLHLLGILCSQRGAHKEGMVLINQALSLQPLQPDYHHNLGHILLKTKQWAAAIDEYRTAVKIAPDYASAWFGIGNAFKGLQQLDEAIKSYKKAIDIQPNFILAHYNLGNTYQKLGLMKSANETYENCLRIQPDHAPAHNNLGSMKEYWEDWTGAELHFNKAIELSPGFREPYVNLAGLFIKTGQTQRAKQQLGSLIDRFAQHPDNHWLQWRKQQISEIIWPTTNHIEQYQCGLQDLIDSYKKNPPTLPMDKLHELSIQPPYDLIYQGKENVNLKMAYGQFFESYFSKVRSTLDKRVPIKQTNDADIKKVGFVVTQGHEGVFIKCMAGLINHLNHPDIEVNIVCSRPNGFRILHPAIHNPTVKYLEIDQQFDQAVINLRKAQFDLLYYWEIGTDATNYFLPFCKLAPVQCTSWGWPTSSGIPSVDYFLTCKTLDDVHCENRYSEKLVFFDRLPMYYERPVLPSAQSTPRKFGLPENKRIYLCAQNLRKVHPDMDEIFTKILQQDPEAILVFIKDKHDAITKKLLDRINATNPYRSDRIYFVDRMPRVDYLSLLQLSHVVLDTIHYSGGANTCYDAFAVGAPFVTMPLEYHKSKFGAAAYQQLGVTDCIAYSIEDYVTKALAIAKNPGYRSDLSKLIIENNGNIFEDKQAVEEMERFLLTAKPR